MNEIEFRAFESPVTLRAAPEGSKSPGTLIGYAAKFNSLSRDLGGWYEEIDPVAFGGNGDGGLLDMARHTRVMARSEHDSRLLLGTTDAGTLRVWIDDIGLPYEVDLPDTTAGRDAAVLADRGDYRFSSFAFRCLEATWREGEDGSLIRRVVNASLTDVAPVANPAYWGSSVAKRDFDTPDLDAVRASLHPGPAPASEANKATVARLFASASGELNLRARSRNRAGKGAL